MTIQIKKTYRGLNPGMLCDEVQGLLQKQGIMTVETESQTYGLPSGDTQSRTTLALKTTGRARERPEGMRQGTYSGLTTGRNKNAP